MIPKKIHYIWFGGKVIPEFLRHIISNWRKVLPDYEIIEWNESNFDIEQHHWMKSMHEQRRFGFVGDWARLKILNDHGGIYLDTDVEVFKPLDEFLKHEMFWGFEYDCYLATCFIGSRPNHPLLNRILTLYDGLDDNPISNSLYTRFFLNNFPDFTLDNRHQVLDGNIHIYPKEYFSVPSFDSNLNFARHHGTNLWNENLKRNRLKKLIRCMMGEPMYYKLVNARICRTNEFSLIHRMHTQ